MIILFFFTPVNSQTRCSVLTSCTDASCASALSFPQSFLSSLHVCLTQYFRGFFYLAALAFSSNVLTLHGLTLVEVNQLFSSLDKVNRVDPKRTFCLTVIYSKLRSNFIHSSTRKRNWKCTLCSLFLKFRSIEYTLGEKTDVCYYISHPGETIVSLLETKDYSTAKNLQSRQTWVFLICQKHIFKLHVTICRVLLLGIPCRDQ